MNCLIIIETGVLGSEFLSCQVQYEIWEPTQYKVSVCLSFELNMKGLGRINLFFIVHREHLNEIKVKWTADSQGRAAPGSGCLAGVGLFEVAVIMLEHQRRRQPQPGRQVQIKGAAWWLWWLRSLLSPVGAQPLPPGQAQNIFSAQQNGIFTRYFCMLGS